MRHEVTLESIDSNLLRGEIIYNYLYPSHLNIGNIYVIYIDLPDRHYVNPFHPQLVEEIVAQAFALEQILPRLSMSCSFWAVSRPHGGC